MVVSALHWPKSNFTYLFPCFLIISFTAHHLINEMKSFDRKYISTTRFSVEVKSQDCWSNKKSLCSTTARHSDATGEISHAATAAASAVAVPVCFCLQQDRWHHATLHEPKLYDEPTKSEVWKFYGLELLINFYWLRPQTERYGGDFNGRKCQMSLEREIQHPKWTWYRFLGTHAELFETISCFWS